MQGFFEPQDFLKREKQGIKWYSEGGNEHRSDSFNNSSLF